MSLWSLKHRYDSGGSVGSSSTQSVYSRPESPAQAQALGQGQAHGITASFNPQVQDDHQACDSDSVPVLRFLDSILEYTPAPMDEFMKNGVVSSDIPDVANKTTGMKSTKKVRDILCPFCRNNGESSAVYRSHGLRDTNGKITCPVLRRYVCPICKSTGDNAHTISYCPSGKSTDEMKKNGKKTTKKVQSVPSVSHLDNCDNAAAGTTQVPIAGLPEPPPVRIQFVPIPVSAAALASFQNIINCQSLSRSGK
jgi:protein nanos 1